MQTVRYLVQLGYVTYVLMDFHLLHSQLHQDLDDNYQLFKYMSQFVVHNLLYNIHSAYYQ